MARRPGTGPAPTGAGGTTSGSLPVVDPGTARSRRRFARRQWRRRWGAWKYLVAGSLALVLVVVGIWAVWFSSYLAVDGVEVRGTQSLSADEVRAAAGVRTGQPLARVDLAAVRARVESLAVVRSAEVTRRWPDQVLVSVRERVAVAVVTIGGQVRGMDDTGVVFRGYRTAPPDLPRVQTPVGTPTDALREAALVISALPESLTSRLDHVEVESVDQISLELRDGRVVVWGSATDSDTKAEVLEALLGQQAQEYDVSVPGRPTTRD